MSSSSPDMDAAIAKAGLVPGQSPSPVRLADPASLFANRAARLRTLAPGHSLADWLLFVATIAEAQQVVAAEMVAQPKPPERQWLDDLQDLLNALPADLPPAARPVAATLATASDDDLAIALGRIHAGQGQPGDLAAAPFLVAAEQIAWTRHAAILDPAALTPDATSRKCPVCGQPPVVGMIHIGAASAGLRYLHCGTCGTAWHHVRATCVACGDARGLVYHSIEGGDQGVRAECCNACHSTLKLFLLEKNPDFDPIADDLASLALDILVDQEGFHRIGGNPFLAMPAEG